MPKKKAKIDWRSLDWAKENVVIARETGFCREYVRQMRQALFPPKSLRKPRGLILRDTARDTAAEYGIPPMVAGEWHREAGRLGKRGRPKFVLPRDFRPTTVNQDAKRFGVAPSTLYRAMQKRGITTGRGKGPNGCRIGCFTLPADFVPTTLAADGARFGVSGVTIRTAMIRQGIKPAPKTLPKCSPNGWVRAREEQGPA